MTLKTLSSVTIKSKVVLVRVDFNVPIVDGKITSDKRIRAALPTIKRLLSKGAKQIILMSHLGRPDGKPNLTYSLEPVAKRLEKLVAKKVFFSPDCINVLIPDPRDFKIVLLENLRFYKEETQNDATFAKQLASYADVYVNDAFGTSHRKHASVHAITRYIPSVAGLLLESEIKHLDVTHAKKPLIVILGGSKVSSKIGVIKNLVRRADGILIGGAMSFTFFKAMGREVGKSRVEDDKLELAMKLLRSSKKKLVLPIDVVVSTTAKPTAKTKIEVVSADSIPKNKRGLDIGPETILAYGEILKKAKTIVWNGPLGLFEVKPFYKGTFAIAKLLAESKAKTIIGGGDSVAAVEQAKVANKMTHISTGGGASLEMLEGKVLPAVKVLMTKD